MTPRYAAVAYFIAASFSGNGALAQTLGNQSLNGQYYFRHVSLGTTATGALNDARSLIGSIAFDGNGHYSFSATQVIGNNGPSPQAATGTYAVDSAGMLVMDSPARSGTKLNARLGTEAVVGSSTESSGNLFDLFIAIPVSVNAQLTGQFWTSTLEFPGANLVNARDTMSSLFFGPLGRISDFTVTGHAANISNGATTTQQVIAAAASMARDGSGLAVFGASSNRFLLSGTKTLFLSASGNVILGGSTDPGSHDILIGVKAVTGATNSTWNGTFWSAGLRLTANLAPADAESFAGAAATRGPGKLVLSRRIKTLAAGAVDFTGTANYSMAADGSAAMGFYRVGLGAGGKAFVGSVVSDANAYEIFFGTQAPAVTGSGVFLDPQRILNAASFAPPGTPIAPGEYIALFGSGLARSNQTSLPPYPPALNGVTVLIGGKPAPLYFVSAGQINCLVPFSTEGPTTTVQVLNADGKSNTVTVPVAPAAPGVFALDGSGTGFGAIQHADFSLVNADHPAERGETVLIYLTGLGAVNPSLGDGALPGVDPLSKTPVSPTVLISGEQSQVLFSGLVPGVPGLYLLIVVLPPFFPNTGNLPLAISMGAAFHDQVDIAVR